MRTRSIIRLVLTVSLLSGGAALAREVKEFQAPRQMTPEELEAAKLRAKNGNMNAYQKDVQIKAERIPWMAIGLGVLALAVAAPFGVWVYKGTAKEMATANTFGSKGLRDRDDEE
jgi:hypothetical protein